MELGREEQKFQDTEALLLPTDGEDHCFMVRICRLLATSAVSWFSVLQILVTGKRTCKLSLWKTVSSCFQRKPREAAGSVRTLTRLGHGMHV